MYINALLDELQTSPYALRIGNIVLCVRLPRQTISFFFLSRRGLNELLNMCLKYANKWRYLYNPSKCAASVLRRKKIVGCATVYVPAMYGITQIRETDSYKHLGIVQSGNGKHPYDIDAVTRSIRGTFLSLAGTVSGRAGPNPGTAMKLYYRSVLPHSVFGCELWNDISKSDIHQLEIAHHFCLKRAQGLPALTRSDMVTGLLGVSSLEVYIDLQKLSFFGLLCRTTAQELSKQLLLYRLYQFKHCDTLKLGYIPDIARILKKYDMIPLLWRLSEENFPSKTIWKRLCKQMTK